MSYTEGFKARMIQRMAGPEGITANALSKEVGVAQPVSFRQACLPEGHGSPDQRRSRAGLGGGADRLTSAYCTATQPPALPVVTSRPSLWMVRGGTEEELHTRPLALPLDHGRDLIN